ncbi:polar amino acid transport system ATP-binding protein [Glycomyces harbinensis]|uniref:Polar amino acid transport system ATP-binding protein n=1 Tax=Glycomyces harbinensis TaxID=58114 RepID=A0A1G7CV68_9ACTN|nr:ectoine/hydroxyectoine ABC transporter ATP-binding protein EhuA [Glycomyces harbinensis]SDE42650.1 polar amino acid transport system ATP-binding protein [Glycomyces harbinensis]
MQSPITDPSGAEPLIEFDRVDKSFGDLKVLDKLNFRVDPGERVTLIGPSGSGKTTILRLLMTLEKVTPTADPETEGGVIYVEGKPYSHMEKGGKLVPASERWLRQRRSRVGMVFQQFNLFPNMKVLRNVTEAQVHVAGRSKAEAEAKAGELLELVGLSEKADEYPARLSGGQQQRVAIARALAMDPDILLLDEVTSALDPELVADVLAVLRDVAETTSITMLCVTHEMGFARDVSNRVLMFDNGQIVEQGAPEAIFSEPQEARTQDFLRAVLAE